MKKPQLPRCRACLAENRRKTTFGCCREKPGRSQTCPQYLPYSEMVADEITTKNPKKKKKKKKLSTKRTEPIKRTLITIIINLTTTCSRSSNDNNPPKIKQTQFKTRFPDNNHLIYTKITENLTKESIFFWNLRLTHNRFRSEISEKTSPGRFGGLKREIDRSNSDEQTLEERKKSKALVRWMRWRFHTAALLLLLIISHPPYTWSP